MRKINYIHSAAAALLLNLWGSQPAHAQTPDSCTAAGAMELICGDSGAEDLIALPGTDWVVASAYTGSGGLRLIDTRTRHITRFAFGLNIAERHDRKSFAHCPGPVPDADKPKFITHGLALGPKLGGVQTIYAVHHGSRESIEAFALDTHGKTPTLTWTGCIIAPDPVGLNSITSLPNGTIVGTNFMSRGGDWTAQFKRVEAGEPNGELWEWTASEGWKKIPDSEGSGLNGLVASKDGRTLYVASWGSQSLTRMARDGSRRNRMTVPLGFRVDNLRWRKDGQLIAAGQIDGGSRVVTIDPRSMKVTELVQLVNTPGFHEASGAIQLGDEIWLGSYGAPNIAIVKEGGR